MKQKILAELVRLLEPIDFPQEISEKCNAQYLANKFDIRRNTASKHLNELVEQCELVKIQGRPVLFVPIWFLKEKSGKDICQSEFTSIEEFRDTFCDLQQDLFTSVIGYSQSLKDAVQQGISALKYPNGLPIMYFGDSGVGKSFLVEKLAEYCREKGIIAKDAPFMELNCAQYYHNPELLTSQLFGHMKGAFTGAEHDQIGIIEAANGGIVFLDEIHRLPPEGQEKLFIHMDKGVFHRMGETGPWRQSQIRYIFATTEQKDGFFLETFKRRIPIVCTLPAYKDRSVGERKAIVFHLFEQESALVQKDILVSEAALSHLIRLDLPGNIGELAGLIKQTVAGKLTFEDGKNFLEIHIVDLPTRYLVFDNQQFPKRARSQRLYVFSNGNYVHDDEGTATFAMYQEALFRKIFICYEKFVKKDLSDNEFRQVTQNYLSDFNEHYINEGKTDLLKNYYVPELQKVIQKVSPSLFIHLSGYTIQAIANYLSMRDPWDDFEHTENNLENQKLLASFKKRYIRDLDMFLTFFEESLDIKLTLSDRLYIAICIVCDVKSENNDVNAIILAHGFATASSIANVANRLVNQPIFDSIDMPLESSSKEVIDRLIQYIEFRKPKGGLVIFVDMGSLTQIQADIEKLIEVPTVIINNVTTEMAIETAFLIQQNDDIQKVVKDLPFSTFEKQVIFPSKIRKRTIIVSCSTGLGAASKIKEMLEKNLPPELGIEFVPYEVELLHDGVQTEFLLKTKEIIAIIGTDDPKIERIPYITLEELFEGEVGKLYEVFLRLYGEEVARSVNQNIVKNSTLNRLIDSLTILDAEKVMNQIEDCLKEYQLFSGKELSSMSKINLYVHISCMIERLIRNQGVTSFPNLAQFCQKNEQEIKAIENAMKHLESLYNIKIPQEELAYATNIITHYQ
ncbi:sigma 54-interacting transcriptional regulator [Enterococcus asini]|uniref:sigma 54-interacting transcriptional regulator n=1 Tax=Enterococcus TaxID=1350 RepID=UPI002891ABEF|nr:sigma 54-interacting transcriptional regulator [Enterococcus asini]MDT2757159.1 sigma 54-interacting transcriptional regulator [Enterococcus asini]